METSCSNCLKLNQTIADLKRSNQNLILGHDRLNLANAQLRQENKQINKK